MPIKATDRPEIADILWNNKDKNFVRRILEPKRAPSLKGPNGTRMTHMMASGETDGRYVAYPTVVQRKGRRDLEQLDDRAAFEYAMEHGEFIEFKTPEEAQKFSENYKTFWPPAAR